MRLNKPPFVVGITGHRKIHPDAIEPIKAHLHTFFAWLDGHEVVPGQEALGSGLNLANTPIVVLSGMAPGADTLIGEVVAEIQQRRKTDIYLRGALAFPEKHHLLSSSFKGLVEDPADLIEHYQKVMEDARGDHFAVALVGDAPEGLTEAQWVVEREDRTARRRRYQGSGEYIASYSHLLIALSDSVEWDKPESARGIIAAKLNGPTHGLLPFDPSFTWSDNGPVFHLRVGNGVPENPAELKAQAFTPLWPKDLAHEWPDADADKIGFERFRKMCANLRGFNDEWYLGPNGAPRHPEPAEVLEIDQMIRARKQTKEEARAEMEPVGETIERLRWAARVRRRAAWLSQNRLEPQFAVLMRALVLLVMIGAVMFHVYGHWVYADHTAVADHAPAPHPRLDIPTVLLAGALLVGVLIIVLSQRHDYSGREARRYDYRALAEGLRVQIYWSLLGLGASVSARFMQRQRGELDWIRNSISGLCLPYEVDQQAFLRLPRDQRKRVYRQINKVWIEAQTNYFSGAAADYLNRMHFWHQLGHGLVVAALLHMGFMLVHYHGFGLHEYEGFQWVALVGLALVFVFRALVVWTPHKSTQEHAEVKELNQRMEKKWPDLWSAQLLFACFGRHGLASTLCVSCAMFVLLMGVMVAVDGLFGGVTGFLDFHGTRTVMIGVWLLFGALSLAWAEKRLYAEQYRQYAAMRALYRVQFRRVETLLEGELTPEKEQELRDLFTAIGEESLDENAEWLLLHRARPLEPFMPG